MIADTIAELPELKQRAVGRAKLAVRGPPDETATRNGTGDRSTATEAHAQDGELRPLSPEVAAVPRRAEAVETWINEASGRLSAINQAIKSQARDRHALDHHLAETFEDEAAARRASLHDHLTGLPNRMLFADRLEHGLAQARRHEEQLAILSVDLDDFGIVNDHYGYEAGDAVLLAIAQRLRGATRAVDTVSRHGGDAFVILLGEIRDETFISAFVEKLIDTIRVPCLIALPEFDVRVAVNASIGIALFPHHGLSADVLVHSADMAMDSAKQHRSGFAYAEPDPRTLYWRSPAPNGAHLSCQRI